MSDLVEREAVLGKVLRGDYDYCHDHDIRLCPERRQNIIDIILALPPALLPERVLAAVDLAEAVVAWNLWRGFDRNRRATCLFCDIRQGEDDEIDHLSGCEYARYRAARGEG